VRRNGQMIVVDDSRFRLLPGEKIENAVVRFRTLGCYPLTAAVESTAASLEEIIVELLQTKKSERVGRVIDHVGSSMEDKKREGYF
jgi:sulfate adenylyltransferase subunit 2